MWRTLWVLATFALLAALLVQQLVVWDERGIRRHLAAERAMLWEAALAGCLKRDALVSAAEVRGWTYDLVSAGDRDVGLMSKPWRSWWRGDAASALHVDVQPPVPWAKGPVDRSLYHFDKRGCAIR